MTAEENGTVQPSNGGAPGREDDSIPAAPTSDVHASEQRDAGEQRDASEQASAPSSEASGSNEASSGEAASAGEARGGDASSGDDGSGEDDDGEGEGDESSAGAVSADGTPVEGAKRKRRRRRRKKGAPGEAGAPEGAEAEAQGGERPAGERPAGERQGGQGGPRKDAHLPFARFFEGRDRERRHAFSVGEIVAGRVQRVEHGASVIDLFGKATAYALANESRDVPLPGAEPEEPEETAAEAASSGESPGLDLSQVGGAAAGFEGAVGMPASEATPESEHVASTLASEAPSGGPGPDGVWGTTDDEAPTGEADPGRVGRAARQLSAIGTPSEDGATDAGEPGDEGDETASASEAGGVEAPEESAADVTPEEEAPPLDVGQIFRGRVAAVAESGHVAIHNRLVTRADARLKLAKAREEHRRVWGLVYGFNRGGFDVLVEGVRAFCPVSGMTVEHVEDPETLLGRRLEFSVQQAKSGHQGIVISRRSILERESRKKAKELRRSLQPGQTIKGRVTQVRDFGLFVDIGGGVEGLVHMSEVSWDRGVRPADAASPGDEVEVQVLRVTEPQGRKERDGRISLSLKALAKDPWEANLGDIEEGQARKGKVTRTAEFGAFVELVPGVEGLLHITELGRDLKHASERIKEGDDVFVIIERLDKRARRISLSKMSDQEAKLFQEGGLEAAAGKPVRQGSNVKVKVDRVESGGLYVQIEGMIGRRGRGFIPNAEMMTERGTDHRKKFAPGTEIDVKVIGTDREGGLRLSRKAYHQDEERRAVQDYRKEAARKGFGTFGDILKNKLGGKR